MYAEHTEKGLARHTARRKVRRMAAERPRFEQVSVEQVDREKQASRDADHRALATGRMTPRDIERKNLFLDPARTTVHWERAGKL
jgi:hypothetical protein